MSDIRPDDSLLDRYLAGECTPEEKAAMRRRFGDVDLRAAVQEALLIDQDTARFDSARAWSDVRARMAASPRATSPWRTRDRQWRVAAALLFIVGSAIAAPKLMQRMNGVEAEQIVATGIGERRTIRLSDGTSVTLAPLSTLHFPATFSADARTVLLTGQASFSVAHDAARPFSVQTSSLTARVLGTEFDVREDTVAHTVDVAVASGRVRLMTPTDSTGPVLTARQVGHYSRGTITVSNDIRLEDFMGWRTGHLRFERRALREIIPEMERWFDIDIQVADSALASRTLSADLRVGTGATVEALLGAITLPIDARYQRQGRAVTIVPR